VVPDQLERGCDDLPIVEAVGLTPTGFARLQRVLARSLPGRIAGLYLSALSAAKLFSLYAV